MSARAIVVAAFDGGLTNMGAAVARVASTGRVELVDATVLRTEKGAGTAKRAPGAKRVTAAGITASADHRRRVQELSAQVRAWLTKSRGIGAVQMVVVEAFSRPPHAAAGVKLAAANAVVEVWSAAYDLPVAEVSPQTIKAALGVERGLDRDASKLAVQDAVDAHQRAAGRGSFGEEFLSGFPRGAWEHGYDAAAAVLAAVERDRLRALLPMQT